MKVTLETPRGERTVEVPADVEDIRVGVYDDTDSDGYLALNIDGTFTFHELSCVKQLLETSIIVPEPSFGPINNLLEPDEVLPDPLFDPNEMLKDTDREELRVHNIIDSALRTREDLWNVLVSIPEDWEYRESIGGDNPTLRQYAWTYLWDRYERSFKQQ